MAKQGQIEREDHEMPSWREVFLYFIFLGFVNIGGPVAQITMMYNHMVEKRHWLSKDRFVKIMAFCQFSIPPSCIVSVILGQRMVSETRQQVIEFVRTDKRYTHVSLFQARSSTNKFAIEIQPL